MTVVVFLMNMVIMENQITSQEILLVYIHGICCCGVTLVPSVLHF